MIFKCGCEAERVPEEDRSKLDTIGSIRLKRALRGPPPPPPPPSRPPALPPAEEELYEEKEPPIMPLLPEEKATLQAARRGEHQSVTERHYTVGGSVARPVVDTKG